VTGVPPENQKVFPKKGKVLKEGDNLGSFNLKEGCTISLMGSATEIPKVEEQVVFVEDLPPDVAASALAKFSCGLDNLQNTCYLNSCLQCMRAVPELRTAIAEYRGSQNQDSMLVSALQQLFAQMEKGGESVTPMVFVSMFRQFFPQFAAQRQNVYMQQDADECWGELARVLKSQLRTEDGGSVFDNLFVGNMRQTLTCIENPDDTSSIIEPFHKLPCYVDKEVTFVNQGIMRGMEGSLEKHSEILGTQANYTKVSRISTLPTYLLVSFNRFDQKNTADGVIGLKVLKPISFPFILDVHQLCDDDLGKSILDMRNTFTELREREAAKAAPACLELRDVDKKNLEEKAAATTEAPAEEEHSPMEVDAVMDVEIPPNPQLGYYDLKAIVTHKGRALSSGHYMGYAKDEKHGCWVKFDDDDVYEVPKEEIMKLNGGGDWDMAYLCIYKVHHELP